MPLEHEVKFSLPSCLDLITVLDGVGRRITSWHLESNTVYDRHGQLAATSRLLRLRRGAHTVLTFKEPGPEQSPVGIKTRLETECLVADFVAMDRILRGLGYTPGLRYEKFRAVWDVAPGKIYLDILPFGHFLEIEAPPDAIGQLAVTLGLDPSLAMAQSYHDLHRQWREEHGLHPSPDFLFNDTEKQRLSTLLDCPIHQGDRNAD